MFSCHYSWECDRLAKLNVCVRNLERDRTAFRPAVLALEWRTNPAQQTSRCSNDAWHSPIIVEALLLLRLCSVVHSERRLFLDEQWTFNGVISVFTYCCSYNFACPFEVLPMFTVQASCPSVLYDVPAPNLHKYTWTSPDGKTDNQIDHLLVDRRWMAFEYTRCTICQYCDTDNYLVIWRG